MVRVESRILKTGRKLPEKMATQPTLFVAENPVRFADKNYSPLIKGEDRIQVHDLTGVIRILSWRDKEIKEEEISLGEEVVLSRRGKNPKVRVGLRCSEFPDIETAIKGTYHILESYEKRKGKTVQNTRAVVRFINNFFSNFRSAEVTKENLPDFFQNAVEILLGAGFITATKPRKQEIAQELLAASSLDSRGRFNPLISRTKLASCSLAISEELLSAKDTREKYSLIAVLLNVERKSERFSLERVKSLMEAIVKMPLTNQELSKSLAFLKRSARQNLMPDVVRSAPYRKAAIISLATLFGVRTEEGQVLIGEMLKEDQEKLQEILAYMPIDRLFKTRPDKKVALLQIKERINFALPFIDQALLKGQQGEIYSSGFGKG